MKDADRDHLKVLTEAQLAREVRIRRDILLVENDWMVVRALETGDPLSPEWAAYRKALRDITKQPGFPTTVTWPEVPTTP